ncbi:MAG: hypothetical protein HZC36_03030 [Armatimonadetes bacterium]|nr:hypothetical protein [Armatimonadota bacterium]
MTIRHAETRLLDLPERFIQMGMGVWQMETPHFQAEERYWQRLLGLSRLPLERQHAGTPR